MLVFYFIRITFRWEWKYGLEAYASWLFFQIKICDMNCQTNLLGIYILNYLNGYIASERCFSCVILVDGNIFRFIGNKSWWHFVVDVRRRFPHIEPQAPSSSFTSRFFFFLQKIKNKTDFEREFWFASYLNSRLLSLDYSALCLDPHQCKPYALAARSSVPNPYDRDPMQVLLSQHHHIHHVEASYGQHIGAVLNCKQQHQQHKTQFVNIMNCDWFQTTVLP